MKYHNHCSFSLCQVCFTVLIFYCNIFHLLALHTKKTCCPFSNLIGLPVIENEHLEHHNTYRLTDVLRNYIIPTILINKFSLYLSILVPIGTLVYRRLNDGSKICRNYQNLGNENISYYHNHFWNCFWKRKNKTKNKINKLK